MHIKKTGNFSLNDGVVLIGSLPDMGKVGGLVTQHLKKALKGSEAAKIILQDKPWVSQRDGIIDYPADEYQVFVSEEKKIVIFSGEGQPQESSTVIELTGRLFETVGEIGEIRLVISAGGYLPNERGSGVGDVFGVATNKKMLETLKSHGVGVLNKEVSSITWFNGLVLGQAKERSIDGVGLFGRIEDPETPQYGAASSIVKKISGILGMEIDTKELDDKVAESAIKGEKEEEKRSSPGIG